MEQVMKLTEQQQKDIDKLVEQFEMINSSKENAGKIIDIGTIKREAQVKANRVKEIKLINKNWELVMDQTIDAELEMLKEDIEALGLTINKVSDTCIYIRLKTDEGIPIYYEFNQLLDELSNEYIRTGIRRKAYVSGNTSYIFKSLEEFATHDRIILKLKHLHEGALK